MIYIWRLLFKSTVRTIGKTDAMLVRAPTAEDAMTMFTVNWGERADRVVGLLSVVEYAAVNCPICFRRWDAGHTPECKFRFGWVLESQIQDIEVRVMGLPSKEDVHL